MTTRNSTRQAMGGAFPRSPQFMPVKTFSEQFERMLFIVNENVRLWESWKYRNEEMQTVVRETKRMCELADIKNRTCERCPDLERRVRNQEELITEMAKAIPKDHDSYEVLTQKVSELKKPKELPKPGKHASKENNDDKKVIKTPETDLETHNREVSPIVKRSRNNKRRLKCISSKKKNKLEDDDGVPDTDLDLDFSDIEVVTYSSKSRMETPDVINIVPFEGIKELDHSVVEEQSLTGAVDMIEPTQKAPNRRVESRFRRSLVYNSIKPNLNDATIEQIPDEHSKDKKDNGEKTKSSSPLNIVITNPTPNVGAVFKSPERPKKTHLDDFEKMKQRKWNLTKSREPTTAKLKQTLLSTVAPEKKTDISTLESFNGGLLRTEYKKIDSNAPSKKIIDNIESSVEPTFDSAITSTANEVVLKTPVKANDRFSKYLATRNVDNSFENIPKTSPNYKYKRDAVRKQSERRKLPGQDCDMCAKFYEKHVPEIGETQVVKLMNKCSRHRDKYSIKSNTPPGFWNPVFDTDDG